MKKILILIFLFCFPITLFADDAPSLAQILEWKYGACLGTKQADPNDLSPNPKMIISYWKCGVDQPSEEEIKNLESQFIASKNQNEELIKKTLNDIFQKLNLSAEEVDALIDAVRRIK